MRPASVTKIMTLLLIFDAIKENKISYEDIATTSAYAASMGGSQVFLEEGEVQTVRDLIKCISICSANDACVVMAELIGGTEEHFVEMMNQRAKELGMENTNFVNCCGLEAEGHLTCAYDIALMSQELITKHPEIFEYCTIWMDTITHHTRKGDTVFGLTNTNKFLRSYSHATGLKTGYTSASKYCLAATAEKDGLQMIAVVMAEENPKQRTKDVIALCDYGFSNCKLYQDTPKLPKTKIPVHKGKQEKLSYSIEKPFEYLFTDVTKLGEITRKIILPKEVKAPIQKGDAIGSVRYYLGEEEIGTLPIVAEQTIAKQNFFDFFKQTLGRLFFKNSGASS